MASSRLLLLVAHLAAFPAYGQVQSGHTLMARWSADSINFEYPTGMDCNDNGGLVSASLDTTVKAEGLASMKYNIPSGSQGGRGCKTSGFHFPPAEDSWFNGHWICSHVKMKLDAALDWNVIYQGVNAHKFKASALSQIPDTPGLYILTYFQRDGIDVETGQNVVASVPYDFRPAGVNSVTEWHDYVIGIRKQSAAGVADGGVKLWVDGVAIGSDFTADFCDPFGSSCNTMREQWGSFATQLYNQTPAGVLWVDDLLATIGSGECVPRNSSVPGPSLRTSGSLSVGGRMVVK